MNCYFCGRECNGNVYCVPVVIGKLTIQAYACKACKEEKEHEAHKQ